MRYEDQQIDRLTAWANLVRSSIFHNEDDVETKFVLPLFEILGYPHNCRRGKLPLSEYRPGKPGRKPEIDQIYFSTEDAQLQNADTSLILVEAKEPQETNLEKGIEQAMFYGYSLKPVFLVVTNGVTIKIYGNHQHRREELVFDITLDDLCNVETAKLIYRQLNFDFVKGLKDRYVSEPSYKKQLQFEEALRRYPDLRELIEHGDFQDSFVRYEREVISSRGKIAIECTLPLAYRKGSYKVKFSNITRRNLSIHIDHDDILKYFMTGLRTPPEIDSRRFLNRLEKGVFEAHLGSTITNLSKEEAEDLCSCVDDVSHEYRQSIIDTESLLETWEYIPAELEDFYGFYLVSVKSWLWKLMLKFSHEYDWGKGTSDWHIFERQSKIIRVSNGIHDHAYLCPKIANGFWSVVPDDYVQILFEIPEDHLEFIGGETCSWKQKVGPLEVWTARYTRQWLLEEFMPKVYSHYKEECKQHINDKEDAIIDDHNIVHPSLHDIDDIKKLLPYLDYVQNWFHVHLSKYLLAPILQKYYLAFTQLIRKCDPNTVSLKYFMEKLSYIDTSQDFSLGWDSLSIDEQFQSILSQLEIQVERIQKIDYEHSHHADSISRVFVFAVREGIINCTQSELNVAKEAILPLWDLSLFDIRYVHPRNRIFPL